MNLSSYPWIATAIYATAGLLLVAIAFRLLLPIIKRLAHQHVKLLSFIDYAEEPARLFASLIVLQAVWHAAPQGLAFIGGLRHATTVALIGALTWAIIRGIQFAGGVVSFSFRTDVQDNLHARRILTQTRVLTRALISLAVIFGVASALMTFPSVRQVGAGLLASAGLAGIVVGFAAKPVLGNLLAGLQIALTQPIRLDDVVIVENEYGNVEEITGSYVVVRLWDQRRLIVPLQWFIEHPFQNWTRLSSQILGTVELWVDYGIPLEEVRAELHRICESTPEWDKRVSLLQVTQSNDKAMQIRALVSSASSSQNWNLRCVVRERLIEFIKKHYPHYLPRLRADIIQQETPTVQ